MANALQQRGGRSPVKNSAKDRRVERPRTANSQKQALNLQRENILSQRTSNPARRAALEAALAQIEAQIATRSDGNALS